MTTTLTASHSSSKAKYAVLISALLGWMFDGFEMGIFPLIARPALQDLLHTTNDAAVGFWMGNITALFLVGAALGGALFGWLGDKWGRVRSLSISILIYSFFTAFCAFATEPWQIGVFRFIGALGMGGEWALGVALVMEWWPNQIRPWLAGAIGSVINIGFALIPMTVLLGIKLTNWRMVMLAGVIPALLTFFIRFFVPESEKWSSSVKEQKPIRTLFSKRFRFSVLVAIALSSIALIGTWSSVHWIPLWADQMTKGALPQAKAYTQIAYALGAFIGAFLAPLATYLISRKPLFFVLSLASYASCAFLFTQVNTFDSFFLFMVAVVGCTTGSLFGWLALYLPELFPTSIRATGQGLCFNFGRIFAAVGALTMGQLLSIYNGSYAAAGATTCMIYIVGTVFIWWAPKTDGIELPD